jgi:hypothetical protein
VAHGSGLDQNAKYSPRVDVFRRTRKLLPRIQHLAFGPIFCLPHAIQATFLMGKAPERCATRFL